MVHVVVFGCSCLHGLLLAAGLLACSVPIVFTLEWKRTRCGPHQGSSMVQAVTSAAQNGPTVLLSVLTWIVSPIVLGCLVMLLVFWLIVVQGQRVRFRREKTKLRIEFDSYRREMQAKVVLARRGKGGHFGLLSRAGTELIPAVRPAPPASAFPAFPLQLDSGRPGPPSAGLYDALMQLHPYAARTLQIIPQAPPGHATASRLGEARF